MKVHIITVVVPDLNEVGKESIFYDLAEGGPDFSFILDSEAYDIGDWSDDHPLNYRSKSKDYIRKLRETK